MNKLFNGEIWDGGYNDIIIYEITPTKENLEGINTARQFNSQKIHITLAEAQNGSGKGYQFYALGDSGYYGYRQALENDGNSIYNDYIYAVNEKRVAQDVPAGMTATYSSQNGFVYGPAEAAQTDLNRIYGVGSVEIKFDNGQASGAVVDGKYPIFRIDGDVTALRFESTHYLNNVNFGDIATLNPKFINSSDEQNDLKYITGVAKGETWAGVLGAEKK